jgi:hypothetical protein
METAICDEGEAVGQAKQEDNYGNETDGERSEVYDYRKRGDSISMCPIAQGG